MRPVQIPTSFHGLFDMIDFKLHSLLFVYTIFIVIGIDHTHTHTHTINFLSYSRFITSHSGSVLRPHIARLVYMLLFHYIVLYKPVSEIDATPSLTIII